MKETDLYEGVRVFFEERGFTVRGEVRDMDVCAVREELLVGIELKRNFSADLLVQGALRQKVCDLVYVAVPKPKRVRKDRAFRSQLYLLRRLELGLLFVDVERGVAVEVLEPVFYEMDKARRAQVRNRAALFREMAGRSLSGNLGGSSGRRLLTAYREEALKVVALLRREGRVAPRDLRRLGLRGSLLRDNHYGWFERVERGVYALSGSADLGEFEELVAGFLEILPE